MAPIRVPACLRPALIDFAQVYNPYLSILQTAFGAIVNVGEVHTYWQQNYPDSQGQYHSNVDTTRLINVPQGQLYFGWSAFSEQFFGETAYHSSDIPGGATFPASFNNLQVQTGISTFQPIPCPFLQSNNQTPARWAIQSTGCTSFNIWTSKFS